MFNRDDQSSGLGGNTSCPRLLIMFSTETCVISWSFRGTLVASISPTAATVAPSQCFLSSSLFFFFFVKCFSRLHISSSHQAVPGGAAQCHRAQRCRTIGHLHSQRGKRRNLCLQSYWRQHRPPGRIRVWRPVTGGMKGTLCVRKVPVQAA